MIAFTVLVTGNNPPKPSTAPSLAALAAKLAIGLWLVVIAIRYYRKLGKPKKPPKKPPRWQTHIDNMTPWYAIGLGPLTQPWELITASRHRHRRGQTLHPGRITSRSPCSASSPHPRSSRWTIYAGFPPPASAGIPSPGCGSWIDSHTDQVIIIVSLVLGSWLVANSIYYLVT